MSEAHTYEALRRLLQGADIVPLGMALALLRRDSTLLEQLKPHIRGPWDHQITVPDELASSVRDEAARELALLFAGKRSVPPLSSIQAPVILKMMSTVAGQRVDERYLPLVLEQIFSEINTPTLPQDRRTLDLPVVIIGAGAAGLCAAIKLGQAGIPYIVLEKNRDVGGTWYENRYPGCAVDLPSHLYEYSFEPNLHWPRYYAGQESVFRYLSHCADKYGVRRNIRFGHEATSAAYDESTKIWEVVTKDETGRLEPLEAGAVICAVGLLNRPVVPDIAGLDDFRGTTVHTAEWKDNVELRGKRVALIGTGASGIQVGPAIAADVASLTVFQRSPTWAMRRSNIDAEIPDATRWVMRNVPFYAACYRFQLFWAFGDSLFDVLKVDPQWQGGGASVSELNAKYRATMVRHIQRELQGREDLLPKVIPNYPPFGKRVLADTGWYRMLRRPNVHLIEAPIERIACNGVRTNDGQFHEAEAIVFATGFHAGRMLWPMDIRGREGETIRKRWGDDNPRAYLGITVPKFPNLFVLYGPNTNFGHGGSAIFLAECQVHYIVNLILEMRRRGCRVAEIREDVHDNYNELIDAKLQDLTWSHVKSWYQNSSGRVIINQPWPLVDYWMLTHNLDVNGYCFG